MARKAKDATVRGQDASVHVVRCDFDYHQGVHEQMCLETTKNCLQDEIRLFDSGAGQTDADEEYQHVQLR